MTGHLGRLLDRHQRQHRRRHVSQLAVRQGANVGRGAEQQRRHAVPRVLGVLLMGRLVEHQLGIAVVGGDQQHAAGARCVLIVTGKGGRAADPFQPPAPAVDTLATPGDASAAPGSVTIVPLAPSSATVNGRSYDEVYRSIPFNHTEYLANPGYRHDATMEMLFGTLRPTTIVKDQQPQPIINDVPPLYQPYRWSQSDLWQNRAPALRIFNQGSYWR